MKDENKKELATQAAGMPAMAFEADCGGGMEGADKDSFAIPFLRVIQGTSPQVDETSPLYDPNAKKGMLVNSVTGELFDGKTGVVVLPCAYQRRFIRWGGKGTQDEGMYKGELLPEEVDELTRTGKVVNMDGALSIEGDELTDTRSHYVILVTDNGATQALLPLTSTQIKKSKQLMSILSAIKVRNSEGKLVTPPTWMNKIRITTVPESNDKGSWYGVKFAAEGFINDAELYNVGKQFSQTVNAGNVKPTYAAPDEQANKF